MRITSNILLSLSIIYTIAVLAFITSDQPSIVKADTTHIVISQIQISGATASDEFVELYNPTDSPIDLGKWRLTRKTSTGGSVQNLVASLSGTIAPKKYFLVTHPAANSSTLADAVYSSSSSGMTTNNTITLFSDAGVTVVDKVGMGTAADIEGAAFADNPEGGESIVRKATAGSTAQSLFTGGNEANLGNGFDTDNNANDFVLFTTSLPRNSTSTVQPTSIPSITNEPTPSVTTVPSTTPTTIQPTNTPAVTPSSAPTNTPIPTSTPTPTVTPTLVPTATTIPSPTPTTFPTITPTIVPTATKTPIPTVQPTATTTPVPTVLPTSTPAPTGAPTPTPATKIIVDTKIGVNRKLVCVQTFRTLRILHVQVSLPKVTCSIVRI